MPVKGISTGRRIGENIQASTYTAMAVHTGWHDVAQPSTASTVESSGASADGSAWLQSGGGAMGTLPVCA